MEKFNPLSIFIYLISIVIFCLSLYTITKYSGNGYVYILFTITSNALLYLGFRKNAIFFDTFIGLFLWLGFWLKLTIRVAFMDGRFHEAVGSFNGSPEAFDRALLVTSSALLGFIVASIIRERFIFNYPKNIIDDHQQGLFRFYKDHRKAILVGFVFLFVTVAISNVFLGIYQRGTIPSTILPYGLSGVYKWLLLFGLATFSAIILKFERVLTNKTSYLAVMLSLIESMVSNISLMSRGMILNVGSLMYGLIRDAKIHQINVKKRFLLSCTIIIVILFGSSVFAVNYIRASSFHDHNDDNNSRLIESATNSTKLMFLDRWVGIEGVMAVSSYHGQSWDLWKKAWQENFNVNDTSFYDNNIITSPYVTTDKLKHHFISLPGIVAFCFYPGSFIFLFVCMFILSIFAGLIEIITFKLGGYNIILTALLAQVIAFRFASFGYVPAQTYLLFGTIILNVVIIYLANKFLLMWQDR
tara:strand:+ start:135485 stop:136897 length:1413 start_codon:yes stop_codon:yes gene_type:complete